MAEYALARGHTLTFFNRGKTNPGVLPSVERIQGDRNGQLDGLEGPQMGRGDRQLRLRAAARAPECGAAQGSVPHYLFISTVSVYASFAAANDEDSPVGKLADPTVEKVDGETYGPLKALSESAAREVYGPAATTILRPGLIVGPDDNTDRFTYWPARAARGGEFAAPNKPSDPVQIVDVRDLAAFAIRCVEQRIAGVFNALSPVGRFTIGDVVDESVQAARQVVKPSHRRRRCGCPRSSSQRNRRAVVGHAGVGAVGRRGSRVCAHQCGARDRRPGSPSGRWPRP